MVGWVEGGVVRVWEEWDGDLVHVENEDMVCGEVLVLEESKAGMAYLRQRSISTYISFFGQLILLNAKAASQRISSFIG